jgi:hypothetical protein
MISEESLEMRLVSFYDSATRHPKEPEARVRYSLIITVQQLPDYIPLPKQESVSSNERKTTANLFGGL